ncbi:MAG TPA: hypothetical protein VGQ39_15210 [Pyrinomonadaceae bacterium]|jgi:hypothetical protein|nr:hypothetical protein [Pyrinomonadaceae bacterium]
MRSEVDGILELILMHDELDIFDTKGPSIVQAVGSVELRVQGLESAIV